VSLKPFLTAVKRLEQLPALVRELGLEPTWHELDPVTLPAATELVGRAAVVGRRAGLLGLGLETATPVPAARAVARRLAYRGQAGLVFALDPTRRILIVVAAAGDCPSLTLDLTRPTAHDLALLERGRTSAADMSGSLAQGWAEALSGQELGARFFAAFRRTLDRLVAALPGTLPRRDRHALGLVSLTRVLVLYFVQSRGWLDGRDRFLREELDRCLTRKQPVDATLFRPLFFGTLNRPPERRRRASRRFGRIPFLNGGLFEAHPLERRHRPSIPDLVWREAFDDLFERYHFAIRDPDEGTTTIGPDMLGRVFEGVMDPDERRGAGVYYTPAHLVTEVVDSALTHWLAARDLGPGRLDDPAPAERQALAEIAVLDPAAGSGAFLLGALARLVDVRVGGGQGRSPATRAVLATNLFGVDVNPNAVRLAELRLWLEVLAAEDAEGPDRVAPLPNLDGFVRQGDSLIEPVQATVAVGGVLAGRVAAIRHEVASAVGSAKQRLLRRLRRAELDAARQAIATAGARVEAELTEVRSALRAPGLFADAPPPARGLTRTLDRLRRERARLRRLARRLRDADEVPWFHYGSQFGDVMARGGFDLVLGNPPWVRAEALGPAERRELKQRSRWFRAAPDRSGGYAHLPDLSIPFLERAVALTRPGGVTAMLLPAKLLTAGYAAVAREELTRRTTLLVAADLTDSHPGAFHATVYPLALVLSRATPPPDHRLATALAGPAGKPRGVAQVTLGRAPWVLRSDPVRDALAAVRGAHPTLADRFRIRLGVKTGCDAAFLDPGPAVERSLVRPVVRGRDVKAFAVTPGHTILWTHDEQGAPLHTLPPAAAAHLAGHEAALRRRADLGAEPFWTVFRVEAALPRWRVVWADLARRLEAAPLLGRTVAGAIPLNTCYVLATPSRDTALRLAVWLNTTWLRVVARSLATRAASGFGRYGAATVGALPLPDSVLSDHALLSLGRAALRSRRQDQAGADEAAAEILHLPAAQRAVLREA
jgi:Eco57I restriction-modification methylase